MEIANTGSTLEPKHIQRLHNSVWYEFKTVSQTRDAVQRTLEFNKKHGQNSATKALEDCIGQLGKREFFRRKNLFMINFQYQKKIL